MLRYGAAVQQNVQVCSRFRYSLYPCSFWLIRNVQWLGISVQPDSEQGCVALYKGTWTLCVILVGQYEGLLISL